MLRLDTDRPVLGIGAIDDVCLRIDDDSRRIEGALSFVLYFIVFRGEMLLFDCSWSLLLSSL